MACEGAKERREGLIADMVKLREKLPTVMTGAAQVGGMAEGAVFAIGAHQVAIDKLAAAVIALAGPCCDDCDDELPVQALRVWCCGTPISGPHAQGCAYDPCEESPIDYTGPVAVTLRRLRERNER